MWKLKKLKSKECPSEKELALNYLEIESFFSQASEAKHKPNGFGPKWMG